MLLETIEALKDEASGHGENIVEHRKEVKEIALQM